MEEGGSKGKASWGAWEHSQGEVEDEDDREQVANVGNAGCHKSFQSLVTGYAHELQDYACQRFC